MTPDDDWKMFLWLFFSYWKKRQHDSSTYDHGHWPSRHLHSRSSRWPWNTAAGRCCHLRNLHSVLLSAEPPCDCHTCKTERDSGISDLQTSFILFYFFLFYSCCKILLYCILSLIVLCCYSLTSFLFTWEALWTVLTCIKGAIQITFDWLNDYVRNIKDIVSLEELFSSLNKLVHTTLSPVDHSGHHKLPGSAWNALQPPQNCPSFYL